MASDEIIGSDSPLTAEQRDVLAIVLDLIVPASVDGRRPSAADVDVLGYITASEPGTLTELRGELDQLDADARERHGEGFAALNADVRQALVDDIRAAEPSFMRTLAIQTVTCYYQHDRVLEAIGVEARPPFPKGYEVPSGDLTLLDPVRKRGRVWRQT